MTQQALTEPIPLRSLESSKLTNRPSSPSKPKLKPKLESKAPLELAVPDSRAENHGKALFPVTHHHTPALSHSPFDSRSRRDMEIVTFRRLSSNRLVPSYMAAEQEAIAEKYGWDILS